MDEIIKKSEHLSCNLSDKFKNLGKLSSAYTNVKKLQFSTDMDELVRTAGLELSKDLTDSIEEDDWITDQKPRHVRQVVIKLVEELGVYSDQLAQYCDEGPHIESTGQYSLYYSHNPKVNIPLINNIKKLFSERIEIFSPVNFKRRTILFGMVKIVLKALVEWVRLQTFNRNGVQQLQIDAKYLQHELSRFVSDENVIFALLDEAVTSARARCIDDD